MRTAYIGSIIALSSVCGVASAATQVFTPADSDVFDLDHTQAYAWGLKYTVPTGETITGARLIISNIWNWQVETNSLKITLMNTPPAYGTSSTIGTSSNYLVTKDDAENVSDYWEKYKNNGNKKWDGWDRMFTWSDADSSATKNTLVYDFNNLYVYNANQTQLLQTISGGPASLTEFKNFIQDGIIGIGFDPDCHYYNDGVKLEITTRKETNTVPGPMAVLPFALGFIASIRRRRTVR